MVVAANGEREAAVMRWGLVPWWSHGVPLKASTINATVERLDLGTEVELTHLRHQLTHSGELGLNSEIGEVRSFFGTGQGGQQELELETLSSIVEQLNDRFGTDFTDVDKLLFDQFEETWVADTELSDQAQSNSLENFRLAFDRKLMHTIVTRMDDNSEIFKRILDDDEFLVRRRIHDDHRKMVDRS